MRLRLPDRRATKRLARSLAARLEPEALLVLQGDLGAGKTFLARAVLRSLGVAAGVPVTSPTFTLVHEFDRAEGSRLRVLHSDLYRVGDPGELAELGLLEARFEGACLMVEWGERFLAELGGDALVLRLLRTVTESGEVREVELTGTGVRSRQLAAGVASGLERD